MTSKPCVKCGCTDRYEKSGKCKACVSSRSKSRRMVNADEIREKDRIRGAIYRAANPEKWRAKSVAWVKANQERNKTTQAAWYAANPERHRASVVSWYEKNKEKVALYQSDWGKDNPELRRIYKHTRRARENGSGGVISKGLSERLLIEQGGECYCCKLPLNGLYHLDHWMPLFLGGSNTDDNIKLLHPRCNQQKGKQHPDIYMARIQQENNLNV